MMKYPGLISCGVCLKDFELVATERYTARANIKTGITTIASNEEPELFDAIDCPQCGCQNILQPRLRPLNDVTIEDCNIGVVEEEDKDE